MRYGILSDIHSNLEALQEVLQEMENEYIDKYLFLGDITGYASNPNECIELFSRLNYSAVLGNHDYAVLGKIDTNEFNHNAAFAIQWTKNVISKKSLDILNTFDVKFEDKDFTLVHANPVNPLNWEYIFSTKQARNIFSDFSGSICFVGHTHIPWIAFITPENKIIAVNEFDSYQFKTGCRYIINPGSVGQPRDNDSRACFLIWDQDKKIITKKRVNYNVELTQDKIYSAKLPFELAVRLVHGC